MHLSLSAIGEFFRKRRSLLHREKTVVRNPQELDASIDHEENPDTAYGPFQSIVNEPTEERLIHFFYQLLQIEDELSASPSQEEPIFSRYGIKGHAHFSLIQARCYKALSKLPYFHEAMDCAQVHFGKDLLERTAQAQSEVTTPILGVDIETYARIQMALSTPTFDTDREQVLTSFHLSSNEWNTIDLAWRERLHQAGPQSIESVALLWKYATAIAQQNPLACTSTPDPKATSPDTAPCSLETYAKISGALQAWKEQGHEPTELLASTFQLSIDSVSDYRIFWEEKLLKNPSLQSECSLLQKKYLALFLTGQDETGRTL